MAVNLRVLQNWENNNMLNNIYKSLLASSALSPVSKQRVMMNIKFTDVPTEIIAKLHQAALSTSHSLSRCQEKKKKKFRTWFFLVLSQFQFSFLSELKFFTIKVLPKFEFLSVVTTWVFKLCHNVRFCICLI